MTNVEMLSLALGAANLGVLIWLVALVRRK